MQKALYCLLLAPLLLSAQTVNQPFDQVNPPPTGSPPLTQTIAKVHSILMAMRGPDSPGDSLSRQLADNMLALALPERRPTQSELTAFTHELAKALNGKALNNDQGTILQQCIVDLLRARSVSNYQLAERLRKTLAALGTNDAGVDLTVRRFLAIGEAVRGPDDQGLVGIP